MNNFIGIGRLVADPETKSIRDTFVTAFKIAINRPKHNDKQEADFLPVVCWGKTAENCGNYLHKGQQVAVRGEVRARSYEDKDGNKRYVTEILALEVQFLERAKTKDDKPDDLSGIDLERLPF